MMKIAVVGTGYVGLANAVLLAQHNEVVALDINAERVAMINRGEPTVEDAELEQFLKERTLHLVATMDSAQAYRDANFIIVATPTDYDPDNNYFDTSGVEAVVA
jgi:UDPglucose 6-dehydrogenase